MKIDVHSHQIEELFYDAMKALPGVTVKVNPDRFSYLPGRQTWLPFRPKCSIPTTSSAMDRKGIDVSVLSMNTPSVYIFEDKLHRPGAPPQRRAGGVHQTQSDRVRFATLPLPDVEAALKSTARRRARYVGIAVGSTSTASPSTTVWNPFGRDQHARPADLRA